MNLSTGRKMILGFFCCGPQLGTLSSNLAENIDEEVPGLILTSPLGCIMKTDVENLLPALALAILYRDTLRGHRTSQ